MTSRLRLPLRDLTAGTRSLSSDDAHYLLRVRRAEEGDTFVAFDPKAGVEARGSILSGGRVELEAPAPAAEERSVIWIHALAKGDKCDAIVRDATELGASEIIFAKTIRSVVDLNNDRAPKRIARWEKIAEEAARQSERARAPRITLATWAEAVRLHESALRICLYEEATRPLRDCIERAAESHVFAAGPEGGFERAEVALAEDAGFLVASLGVHILRTETVPAAVLGALQFLGPA